jgi:geranylgeranyl reductase family protein
MKVSKTNFKQQISYYPFMQEVYYEAGLDNFYDVLIVGAGPSGTACALRLAQSGLKVALLEKSDFPRDKICGDAISTKAVKFLRKNYPEEAKLLSHFTSAVTISSTRFVSSAGREIKVHWHTETCNCPRVQFDNFLFEQVKKKKDIDIYVNTQVNDVRLLGDIVEVDTAKGLFKSSVIISCDGAQSIIAKKLADFKVDKRHYGGAVRAYFEMNTNHLLQLNEVFFSRKYPQGYLWIFPVSENVCNVGFGALSEAISKNKIDLKKALFDVIDEFPELKRRFETATIKDNPRGFGLTLGTRKLSLSGHRFLLCGDAASLIDPFSGDGIGNALVSGDLAAKHILKHRKDMLFSESNNKRYDQSVYASIWNDLRKSTYALRIVSRFPFLTDWGIRILAFKNRI